MDVSSLRGLATAPRMQRAIVLGILKRMLMNDKQLDCCGKRSLSSRTTQIKEADEWELRGRKWSETLTLFDQNKDKDINSPVYK